MGVMREESNEKQEEKKDRFYNTRDSWRNVKELARTDIIDGEKRTGSWGRAPAADEKDRTQGFCDRYRESMSAVSRDHEAPH